MLLSVLLFNSDAWLRLTKSDITKMEKVDEMLLRKILKTPISTPIMSLYLETGAIPIRFIIKERRIMFLHHILTRSKDSLISQVFWAQVKKPAKGDWSTVVAEDLNSLGLHDLTLDEIEGMSKEALKSLVKKRVRETAFEYLLKGKESLKKLSCLEYEKLSMQTYLHDPKLSKRHKRLLFQWRTRMVKVDWNYGLKRNCPLCEECEDTQEHLIECKILNDTPELQMSLVNLEKSLRKREILLEKAKKQRK